MMYGYIQMERQYVFIYEIVKWIDACVKQWWHSIMVGLSTTPKREQEGVCRPCHFFLSCCHEGCWAWDQGRRQKWEALLTVAPEVILACTHVWPRCVYKQCQQITCLPCLPRASKTSESIVKVIPGPHSTSVLVTTQPISRNLEFVYFPCFCVVNENNENEIQRLLQQDLAVCSALKHERDNIWLEWWALLEILKVTKMTAGCCSACTTVSVLTTFSECVRFSKPR